MKRTILIIEDDIIFSRSISNWLRKNNMETECVAQLSSARRKLSSGEYDLVLADLRLPDSQHDDYRWLTPEALLASDNVHDNSRAYFLAERQAEVPGL